MRASPFDDSEASALKHDQDNPDRSVSVSDHVWRLPAGAELLWQTWDDEVIVFNAASGQTHLLDALSAAALREIEKLPGGNGELALRLAERFELDTDVLLRRLREVCAHFDALGLVEPRRP